MNDAATWTSQHATELRNHWWWRPGWSVGRRFYTWHFTFEGQDELQDLVSLHQDALKQFQNLDLIPRMWLHLTVQGLGFVDEISAETVKSIRTAVDLRLEVLGPIEVTFHKPVVRPEAIALAPSPLQPFLDVKDAIQKGIADVLRRDEVHESAEEFQPHVSIAYVNEGADPAPLIRAVEQVTPDPVTVNIARPNLIELHRDNKMYEWRELPHS